MDEAFPSPVPEIPVASVTSAALYYERCLGFHWDWGTDGIGQVSRGGCRLFLTEENFRTGKGVKPPVVVWINLRSKAAVDALYDTWRDSGAIIVAEPESRPWNLHEFVAEDHDGNLLRVFYDFALELPDGGRRRDTSELLEAARRQK